jgi:thioredoxin 1
MSEITFTDKNFEEEVLKSDGLVLVDFWATWCGPCQVMGPIIKQVAEENKNAKVKVGKLNVDENSDTAQKYNVMSIPTLIYFKEGKVVDQSSGVQSKDALQKKLKELA